MNEVVKLLIDAYATFYVGLTLSLALLGGIYVVFKLLDKLINGVYHQYLAFKKRKETRQAAQVPDIYLYSRFNIMKLIEMFLKGLLWVKSP